MHLNLSIMLVPTNFMKIRSQFHVIFGRISAEISAEVSVNLAEISVSAETDIGRFGRSLDWPNIWLLVKNL